MAWKEFFMHLAFQRMRQPLRCRQKQPLRQQKQPLCQQQQHRARLGRAAASSRGWGMEGVPHSLAAIVENG